MSSTDKHLHCYTYEDAEDDIRLSSLSSEEAYSKICPIPCPNQVERIETYKFQKKDGTGRRFIFYKNTKELWPTGKICCRCHWPQTFQTKKQLLKQFPKDKWDWIECQPTPSQN